MKLSIALVAVLATSASAFLAPVNPGMMRTALFGEGKYDGQEWNDAAKADVKSMYNPNLPRSETNFDPDVRDANGNCCDPNGYFPGEGKYKDPIRPSMSFAEYQKAREAGNVTE